MVKSGFVLAVILFVHSYSFSQTINVFDETMLSKKLSHCDMISKYLNKVQHYQYYILDTAYYGITSEGYCSNISGSYNFTVRKDSLCQVYFMSSFPRSSNSIMSISPKIDSLIQTFIKKFGPPKNLIDNRKDSANPHVINGYILLEAAWLINEDRFRIEFSFLDSDDINKPLYGLRIHRFRECYFSKKFMSW